MTKLRQVALSHTPDSDPSNSDGSKSDASETDRSKSDASESSKIGNFHPPESGGDPSVNSKQDPSLKSKPICQVAAQPDPQVLITDQAKQVLKHLNLFTGSRFTNCNSSLEHIRARLREGFTLDELQLVTEYKTEDWRGSEQEQYLRPMTLFTPSKFPAYLQKAGRWQEAGRPKRVDGKWLKQDSFGTSHIPYNAIPAGFRGGDKK